MTREIKFRAWNKYNKTMGKVTSMNRYTTEVDGFSRSPNDDLERMQYTGLLDKNGVDIYEGDIVISTFSYRGTQKDSGKYIVEWDLVNPCFVLKHITNKNKLEYDFVQADLRSNEVIGNIYENPELLEVEL